MSSRVHGLGLVVFAAGLAACGRPLNGQRAGADGGAGAAGVTTGGAGTGGGGGANGAPDGGAGAGGGAPDAGLDGRALPLPLPDDGSACLPALEQVLRNAHPLFKEGDARSAPVVFEREDGVLVTRGAGRLHLRHEHEQFYGRYLTNYFDDQSYGFTIEDFTVVGQQRIRVTYLPLYTPVQTAWRAWKSPGNDATFMENRLAVDEAQSPVPLTVPVGGIQIADQTTVPASRKMEAGELLEFEPGVMSQPGLSTPFSDIFRYRIGAGGMTPERRDSDRASGPLPGAFLGGDTTVTWQVEEPQYSFSQPALNIQLEEIRDFLDGRRLFHTDFLTGANVEDGVASAPAQAGKAGPLRNTTSCTICHDRNGRGEPIVSAFDERSSMAFRLYGEPQLGQQLQPQEGVAIGMGYATRTVQLGDGTAVELRKLHFVVGLKEGRPALRQPAYSARVAPPLIGLGLLEAVDDRTIAARVDLLDCDRDGISGRIGFARDPATGLTRVGRFGWKAEKTSVMHQVAEDAASSLDVGTSAIRDSAGRGRLDEADLAKLTTFMRLIGVPPQRDAANQQTLWGAAVFETTGCAKCHLPTLRTSPNHPLAELRAQTIRPYTDLLLHDMGPDLADESQVGQGVGDSAPPSASEWRTPPLWGLGLRLTINDHAGLLHDGRATDVQQAILWHGGEAERSAQLYKALSHGERLALQAFLESL